MNNEYYNISKYTIATNEARFKLHRCMLQYECAYAVTQIVVVRILRVTRVYTRVYITH